MISAQTFVRLIGLLAMLTVGCAPAYHSYSDCCVPCGYCPPQPLPFSHFDGYGCHSCAVLKYASAEADLAELKADAREYDATVD